MADRTAIEWTDASWNPVRARRRDGTGRAGWHCEHVSEGCRNCYAEAVNARLGTGVDYKPAHRQDIEVFLDDKTLLAPLRWTRPRKIFLGSMTDVFADFVPDEWLDQLFAVMALCPQHVFQVLTKRSQRMRAWFARERHATAPVECIAELYTSYPQIAAQWPFDAERAISVGRRGWPLPNVWLGVSAEDQATADARIPDLLDTPAAVRWVSAEPLLGPINFTALTVGDGELDALRETSWQEIWDKEWSPEVTGVALEEARESFLDWYSLADMPTGLAHPRLDWIVAGGESGPGARPRHPDWARSLRDQCAGAGVPFFDKQHGQWVPLAAENEGFWPTDGDGCIRLNPDGTRGPNGWPMQRVGKRRAGRLLDGVLHDAMPEARR